MIPDDLWDLFGPCEPPTAVWLLAEYLVPLIVPLVLLVGIVWESIRGV